MSFEKINLTSYDHMGAKALKPYDHMTYVPDEFDEVVDKFKHLRQNDSFRKLHIFHARRLGVSKYYELAKQAEADGKIPARYFTWLLKNS